MFYDPQYRNLDPQRSNVELNIACDDFSTWNVCELLKCPGARKRKLPQFSRLALGLMLNQIQPIFANQH